MRWTKRSRSSRGGLIQYEVVFDASEAGYRYWWFPACGLIVLAIGTVFVICQRKNASQRHCFRGYFITGFALLWTTISFIGTFSDYWQLRQALRSGNFEVIEGKVVDFVPMPRHGGGGREHFDVSGHHYEYSDFAVSASFNNSQPYGGPMRAGLNVRITDVGGKIARLEIAR
jgi:hypothetical protein